MPTNFDMNNTTEVWKTWEGKWVGGKFPLRVWLDSSDHSAVFLTEVPGQQSRKAAIKLVPAQEQDAQLARWRRAAALSHPHLLRIFEVGRAQIDDAPFLYVVMEYADEDLSQILPQRPLTPTEVGELLPPVLETLSHLHKNGLVHGHIQPSNIFAVNNKLKLSSDRISLDGEPPDKVPGPTTYNPPEIPSQPLSPAADVWSLGITLIEVLTQHPPLHQEPVTKDLAVPDTVPQPFRGIASACLRRDAQQRSSVADIQRALQLNASPALVAAHTAPERKRSNWRVLLPLLGAIILMALLAKPFSHLFHTAKTPVQIEPSETAPVSQPAPDSKSGSDAKPQKASASRGSVARRVLPDVPRSARNTIQGKIRVTVRVEVDSSGKVRTAALTSPGPSSYFANLALKAAQRWEFTPAESDGQAVPSTWLLRFQFGRASTEVSPERVGH
jgi:TonB family protein